MGSMISEQRVCVACWKVVTQTRKGLCGRCSWRESQGMAPRRPSLLRLIGLRS
jgi:hypothetical protein